ncbi:hypothetical protein LOTGIDRAFT_238055 [Lottia gigantea]|uniref:Protein odr-4 homolog n=1 Tax=Lottia gigantea TaxID=225164 RepID=V4AXC2_LOTGI|nr:hypothetical protein LOTGIDRAFT_238055 [Lottia gigantea]ESP02228.1 hypothetical protein LOTGIDRAFT_238055 [Lottia gigantea]
MGRSIHADEAIQNYIEELIKSGQWNVGLILGQVTKQRDYVLRLSRTPDPVEDEVSEEEELPAELLEELVHKKKVKKKGPKKPKSLDDVNEGWVATHAKQVLRMLPGGLDVIGVFILSPPNISQNVATKLRQILYQVHSSLNQYQILNRDNDITDRITIHIDSLTRKITCRTYDVQDNRSTGHPAEWKYQAINDKWIQLNTSAFLDMKIAVPSNKKSSPLIKQIQIGLNPFFKSLTSSIGIINGAIREASEPLDTSSGKKSRGRDKGLVVPQSYNIEILTKQADNKVSAPILSKVSSLMVLRGQIVSRAFIQGKPTVGDAIHAVKVDLARSLLSRCELLCEDLAITEQDKAVELYNTPVRVFVIVPDSSVEICDYIFQDERTDEVIDRIKELLDVNLTEENLELDLERPAAEVDWISTASEHEIPTDMEVDTETTNSNSNFVTYIGLAASGIVAGLAMVYNFYIAGGDS